jgi:hypothetical protein
MLGYLAADNRPLVAPVWFVADNAEPTKVQSAFNIAN